MFLIIFVVLLCIIIIFLPMLLDYLDKKLHKDRIIDKSFYQIRDYAKIKMKPMIIFTSFDTGYIIDPRNTTVQLVNGHIMDLILNLSDDSCVVLLIYVLEYIPTDKLKKVLNKLVQISGGDLYTINLDKSSPRIYWDPMVKNVMENAKYYPQDRIQWSLPNKFQLTLQSIYSKFFTIVPYHHIKYLLDDKISY